MAKVCLWQGLALSDNPLTGFAGFLSAGGADHCPAANKTAQQEGNAMTLRLFIAAALALPAFAAMPASAAWQTATSADHALHGSAGLVQKRSKPRRKGGSGCDDPQDVIEHPECR